MRHVAALLLLALTACGGGAPSEPAPQPVVLTEVEEAALPPGTSGFTYDMGGWTLCQVRGGGFLISPFAKGMVAHELGHAMGLGHSDDIACVMYGAGARFVVAPCPAEVVATASIKGPFTVTVHGSLELLGRAVEAAALWNTALGREQIVIVEGHD